MLNYPDPELFFEKCLVEAGVIDGKFQTVSLAQVNADPSFKKTLIKRLHDIRSGADKLLERGKPAEDTLGLSLKEWDYRWTAWAAGRKAAFFSRAALMMLGETEHWPYFTRVLSSSHNILFLCSAGDVLQHATGRYLGGPEEELTGPQLARWWERQLAGQPLNFR